MADRHLTIPSSPAFPQHFEDAIHHTIRRVSALYQRSLLRTCDWSDEHCDCRELGTIHHLPSEQEFCERHFRMVEARRG